MAARPLIGLGLSMLEQLPPVLQRSSSYQAKMHALAREIALLDAAKEQLRAEMNPATAVSLLPAWEAQLRLPVGGAGASIAQRQMAVVLRLQKSISASEGMQWEQQVTGIVGPGWSYQEHIPGDATTPPANTLRITLPYDPSSQLYTAAQQQIRVITAAHLALEFLSVSTMLWDSSNWDTGEFA